MVRKRGPGGWFAAAICGVAAAGMAGCVERRYTIRSDPPGALVVVNNEEIGAAPASRNFTYYGAREFDLYLDGYQTRHIIQPIKAPWWDNYLTEFFTENLIPITFRDEREFVYKMEPYRTPPTDDLVNRAEGLRQLGTAPPPPRRRGLHDWLRQLRGRPTAP